jgi:hypothetical protein
MNAAGWVGHVILAIINGVPQVKAWVPFLDELLAHQVSTAIGLCLFVIYIWNYPGIVAIICFTPWLRGWL